MSVYGIGFIGYGEYATEYEGKKVNCYSYWTKMIKNVKDNKWTITEEWKCFQKFAKWYYENYQNGFMLNKELLNKNNTYSPYTVCFLPRIIISNLSQNILNDGKSLPKGISKCKNGFRVSLGQHKNKYVATLNEGLKVYVMNKKRKLRELAEQYKNQLETKVYKTIIKHTLNK